MSLNQLQLTKISLENYTRTKRIGLLLNFRTVSLASPRLALRGVVRITKRMMLFYFLMVRRSGWRGCTGQSSGWNTFGSLENLHLYLLLLLLLWVQLQRQVHHQLSKHLLSSHRIILFVLYQWVPLCWSVSTLILNLFGNLNKMICITRWWSISELCI